MFGLAPEKYPRKQNSCTAQPSAKHSLWLYSAAKTTHYRWKPLNETIFFRSVRTSYRAFDPVCPDPSTTIFLLILLLFLLLLLLSLLFSLSLFLLQMIIRGDHPLANDYPDGRPFANGHLEGPASCKWSSGSTRLLSIFYSSANLLFSFSKHHLLLQNISSSSLNLRIKVQSRGPF